MRRYIVLLGLGAGGLGSVHAQTPIDSALYQYIRGVRAIDNHTHAGLPVLAGQPADSDYDALPVGNMPPYSFPARLTTKNPDFIIAWRELYGYPHPDRSDEHVKDLLALKRRIRTEQGLRYPAWILDKLGIEIALANRLSVGPGLEAPRFRWVPFADPLLYPLEAGAVAAVTPDRMDLVPRERKHIQRYLKAVHLSAPPATLADYTARVVTPTLERWKREQAIAIKYEIGYLRGLDFSDVSTTQAAPVYGRSTRGAGRLRWRSTSGSRTTSSDSSRARQAGWVFRCRCTPSTAPGATSSAPGSIRCCSSRSSPTPPSGAPVSC